MILTFTPNPAVDKTVFVDRIVPGAKHRAPRYTCIPGGKGCNVSRAVKALGRDTAAMVIAGGHTGRHVVEMIETQDGVRCIPFWTRGMTRTITTVLEEPELRQTVFFEPGPALAPDEMDQLAEQFRAALGGAAVATFNGAVQHPDMRPLYRRLITIAHEAGVRCILDSYGPELALGLEARPCMVKPNVQEAAGLVGFPLDSRAAQWRAVDGLHGLGAALVVLSLGAEGALVSRAGERFHAVPPAIEEVNPVGSGDALVAGFAIGMLENRDLEWMGRLGVAMGTANAMSWDIGHFTREDVERIAREVRVIPA